VIGSPLPIHWFRNWVFSYYCKLPKSGSNRFFVGGGM